MIDRKTVDFLLVDSNNLDPKLVIELDDQSHNAEDRQIRDEFVNKALEAAGIPCLRVKRRPTYDEDELSNDIRKILFNK